MTPLYPPPPKPRLRPIGFSPAEISAMINQTVVDQHAEEAAFLWTQRNHATTAPQYALKDLAKLDERVEAHVDGLRIAGIAGWTTALSQLDQGPGEMFAASVLAFESGDVERIAPVLKVGCSSPSLARGLISALGWIDTGVAIANAKQLLSSRHPEERRCGIAAYSIHRFDGGEQLAQAISDSDPRLSARAMRAAAELGRTDLLNHLVPQFHNVSEECRFWAVWSAVRLGLPFASDAIAILQEIAEAGSSVAELAADLAIRKMPMQQAREWLLQIASRPAGLRLTITTAGALGDASMTPWLIDHMSNPEMARVAGGSFSMITGADLGYEDLDGDAPTEWEIDDEAMAPQADSDFAWPKPEEVARWWSRHQGSYIAGVRYLGGKPVDEASLRQVLAVGKQPQRRSAALELALLHPSDLLFETRERALRQRKKVASWTS